MDDITIVYYTANTISDHFAWCTLKYLQQAIGDTPIISVSQKPMKLGRNIVVPTHRSHVNIYRQALIGAKEAKTKYIALAEDDVLYSPEHFKHRPSPGKFAYNIGCWSLYTWTEPMYSFKDRRNLNALICERDLFIEAMEERFAKWPDEDKIPIQNWAEPGKYESHLGVTVRESETFFTNPPNIVFSHETELSYAGLGQRKKLGNLRAYDIPYWGSASRIRSFYE